MEGEGGAWWWVREVWRRVMCVVVVDEGARGVCVYVVYLVEEGIDTVCDEIVNRLHWVVEDIRLY